VDDELGGSGLSGWAWYQLGQMSADSSAKTRAAVRNVFRPRRSTVDVNGVLAQNQALAAENARLRQELATYQHNYAKLRTYAEEARRDLKRLRGESD
jgi:cell shape-determining protein MreC